MQFNLVNIITDEGSWLNQYVNDFILRLQPLCKKVIWGHSVDNIQNGDIAFYLSFSRIVSNKYLMLNKHNLVVHGSALPQGKGWSPMTWQILEGKNQIPMTLFEANEALDSGQIYLQETMQFEGHELIDELRSVQSKCTFDLCYTFIKNYNEVVKQAKEQVGECSFYKKRNKADSQLSTEKTLTELFNSLRVVDNEKYPAFFEHLGHTYFLKIEKLR